MRIVLIHPNYHSGGAEIAGTWAPAWVAYLAGALKKDGYTDVRFIDAMTLDLDDAALEAELRKESPDIVGCTCITPSIFRAQATLEIAKRVHPGAVTVLGGVHATFMYQQVLDEAPYIDVIVRGEGEEVLLEVVRAVEEGRFERDRRNIAGLAFRDGDQIVTSPAHPPIKRLDDLAPDWGILDWRLYKYTPLGTRVAIPNFARGCPFTCSFCSQWKFWRTYRTRTPKDFVDEIESLVKEHKVGFFILADEEPTIHQKKFIALCEELVERDLGIPWGINTRVTDILRDEEHLPLYRKAGLVHVSLGTEASSQLNLELFRKETTVAQNKKAVELLRKNGIVTEAQFIVGLENETKETIEDTYKWAMDWKCDMANWVMYTPWPFSDLYSTQGDRVEVRDYERYNFVTPIMKPDNMTRSEVLHAVLKNYRRFYFLRTLFSYPWLRNRFMRKYLLGCVWAVLKSGFQRKFFDLGRIGFVGQKEVDFKFDERRVLTNDQLVQIGARKHEVASSYQKESNLAKKALAAACGGGPATDEEGRPLGERAEVLALELAGGADLSAAETATLLGEEAVDEFLDPRGFARQRARAKKLAARASSSTAPA